MPQTEYIAKDIAARMLDLSPRRVLELATEGHIRHKEDYNPQTKRRQTVLSADDVKRLAAGRQPSAELVPAPALPPQPAAVPQLPLPSAPPHSRAWLTLDEAEMYCGLPASVLRDLVESGRLAALDVGVRPGGRYRVKRSDLDAIEGIFVGKAQNA